MAKSSRYRQHFDAAEFQPNYSYAGTFQSFHNTQGMAITQSQSKPKKTWSQRLKLNNKSEANTGKQAEDKQLATTNNNLHPVHYVNSMIYGTVRGVPAPRLDSTGLMLRQIPMEVAVVVCSCPEYLNGTKRNFKKASICKKCRGSRLPLAPMGGTVRAPRSTMHQHLHRPPATIQVTSIKKRPSIFNMANDPYDQIRRSRLTSPEFRATRPRSLSPKNRRKPVVPNPQPSKPTKSENNAIKSPKESPWNVKAQSNARQSILNCDINPYELLSDQNSSSNDDDLFDGTDEILKHSRKYENVLEGKNNIQNMVTTVAGQRIKVFPEYEQIDITQQKPNIQEVKILPAALKKPIHEVETIPPAPKRPPRRKQNDKQHEKSDDKTPKSILKRSTARDSPENNATESLSVSQTVENLEISRKKVQFLANNQIILEEEEEDEETEISDEEKIIDEEAEEEKTSSEGQTTNTESDFQLQELSKQSEIKRSFSDRFTSTPKSQPTFLDTWALRNKSYPKPPLELAFKKFTIDLRSQIERKEPEEERSENKSVVCFSNDSIPSVVDIKGISTTTTVLQELQQKLKQIRPTFMRESSVRLQVRQDENENFSQRKTSIMITGNECYSTINVDSTPLYLSSVVVNESSSTPESNTVTINVSSNNVIFNDKSLQTTKTVINVCDAAPTPDIDTLLNNPVEAVKRNLVPHVCGKDDHLSLKRKDPVKKLLEEPSLRQLIDGLEDDLISKLIENSLKRLKEQSPKGKGIRKMIDNSLQRIQDEGLYTESDRVSLASTLSSNNSYGSAAYELMEYGNDDLSDCYHSCSSDITDEIENRGKFYQMLLDATLSEIESNGLEDHQYESINISGIDPIYEEIDVPPPLPQTAPPEFDKKKSIFEGASKYDILSYLVDAKERGITDVDLVNEDDKKVDDDNNDSRVSVDIERNDSGVGSETSKSSRSKWQQNHPVSAPIHLCEDCLNPVETQVSETGVLYAGLVCRKCSKKRIERKEIIAEIYETEIKYGKDLQIILEEFYRPMLVAGLLTPEQLSAIFLNTEELLENTQMLSERIKDALDAAEQGSDEDLLTVNMGKIFLETVSMLHTFTQYAIRQGAASLLLANLEKEKELLRIFLRVSQMENCILRRMNLNSFLMVPVQRVTKYPLLLSRLYKVTPSQLEGRELIKQALDKIELHLNHMNQEAKDVPTKLWRRIASSSMNCKSYSETEMVNIKLRKMSVDVLEWNQDEVKFPVEGKLFFTQPTDYNWKRGRTIKLSPANALLVTNGKPSNNYKTEKTGDNIHFPKNTGIREACLLLFREKSGRYSMVREPLYLDRCVVCREADIEDYFEVQEISTKDTFILKAEIDEKTKTWYSQLQYHSQGMGMWRKRRNALANIMINGMMTRT